MNILALRAQIVLVALFGGLIGVAYGFGIYLFPAIAPVMIEEFGFTYAQMGITTGLVQAGFLFFALASGFLTVAFGPFSVILWSLFLCVVSLGGLIVAPNFIVVSGCLVALGGCAASIWVPMVEVSQHLVDTKYQGRALGFMSSGTSYGVLVNSILITFLLTESNWRDIFSSVFIIACCFLVGIIIFFNYLKKRSSVQKSEIKKPDSDGGVMKKTASIANKDTAIVLLLMFFAGVSCMPYQSYITLFLVNEHAFNVQKSAVVWRIIGFTGLVSGFVMGWVADVITARRALFCVFVSLAISSFILLGGKLSDTQIYIAALLFGLSFYAIYGIIPAYISHMYKDGRAALVFSFGSVALGVGGVLGNVAGGVIKEYSGTFFWIYAIILSAAVLSSLLTFFMRTNNDNGDAIQEGKT